MSATETATRVALVDGCGSPLCLKMGAELQLQLDGYQRGAAIMPVPADGAAWLRDHPTARRRVHRAARLGYSVGPIDRERHADDVYRINTSAAERQGRPMSAGYRERPIFGPNPQLCARHHVYTIGVYAPTDAPKIEDPIVAYLWLYRSGELAMVSSILGHADHLDAGIMYQLFWFMVSQQSHLGGTIFYNLWNSGTDGLRFYKERVGLREGRVEWAL